MSIVLDREVHFDPRSTSFPLRPLLPERRPRSYSWRYLQLDQNTYLCPLCKQHGACTGFSATMEAAARPRPVFGDPLRKRDTFTPARITQIEGEAHVIYHRAKQLDAWAGENYEGSSVLGAVKAGQEKGWWKEYRWALGPGAEKAADDVMSALAYLGPVLVGSHWRSKMWEPDSNGWLHFSGSYEGGHAWLLTAVSTLRNGVWTPNSWGGAGQGWISRNDLVALLKEDGEACIVSGRK